MKTRFFAGGLPAIFLCACGILMAQPGGITAAAGRDGFLTITSGRVSMTVGPTTGGRITSFKSDDFEFLTERSTHPENYGSTFWPSPQSEWKWPPPPVLDSEPYATTVDGKTLRLTSGDDSATGFRFVKEFSPGKAGSMSIAYSIINVSGSGRSVAPWEITRVPKGGIFFFPAGTTSPGKKNFDPVPTVEMDGIVWYDDRNRRPKSNELTIADGSEGWVAYAIDGKVLIKKFPDVIPARQAPGEAEVLLYVSAVADYLEIETQGAYETLPPGGELNWNVEWLALDLPAGVKTLAGDRALVDFVRRAVK